MAIDTNMIRISGLSSGLDTEALVEGMMTTEQTRINKQEQLITRLEWKTEAYRDINTKVKNFREKYLSVLNADSNMLSSSSYNINEVTMLSTTSAVTVTAGARAESGQMTIDSITQLAEAAELKGGEAFNGDALYTDTTLADLDLDTGLVFEDGEISFSINGETFTFDETTTIGSMMTTINTNANAGVKMTYSNLTKGFKIKSKSTGAASQVALVNIKGNAFSATDSAFGIAEGTDNGQDAILSIEGIQVTRPQNTFSIDGITYSLKGASSSAVSFNVDRDIDETVNKITEFTSSYNELIGELQDKLDEEQHRAYDPLTDEERSALSDDEVTKWEDKAKSGQLRNDSYISSLLSTMRSAFYTTVSGYEDSAAGIGLKTGAYSDNGQITIDEDALKQALQNEPDKVLGLFTATSKSTDPGEKFKESGLITRISTAMLDYVDSTVDGALSGLERRVTEAENRLEVLEDRFSNKEEMLWQRFTTMETALSRLNSQSSWLSSLFSSVQ